MLRLNKDKKLFFTYSRRKQKESIKQKESKRKQKKAEKSRKSKKKAEEGKKKAELPLLYSYPNISTKFNVRECESG